MDLTTIRSLYDEIVAFMIDRGVQMERGTYFELADSLFENRYWLERDHAGVVAFCNFWRVPARDIELVRKGERPRDVTRGDVLFIVDYASRGGVPAIWRMVRNLRARSAGMQGVILFHRHTGQENFRYFPRQKGDVDERLL